MTNPEPHKPYSINESALALHEFYLGLVQAGFTAAEAIFLTAQVILGGKGQQS